MQIATLIRVHRVRGHLIADRYTYVPLVGVFVALVWAAQDWFWRPGLLPRLGLGVVTVGVLVACG